jgi:hypothetical protein
MFAVARRFDRAMDAAHAPRSSDDSSASLPAPASIALS